MDETVLVIETTLTGHRGGYLRWVAESFLESGNKVVLAIPESANSHISIVDFNHPQLHIETFNNTLPSDSQSWTKKLGIIGQEYLNYVLFKNVYEKIQTKYNVDYVFITFVDYFLYSLSLLGTPFQATRFSVISMRADFHYRKMGVNVPDIKGLRLKKYLINRLLKISTLVNFLTLDEALRLYYEKSNHPSSSKVKFLPEPAEYSMQPKPVIDEVAVTLGLNPGKKIILVYGMISSRKGIQNLLEAMNILSDYDFQVILAGKMDREIKTFLTRNSFKKLHNDNKIVFIDRYITSKEESVLFSTAYACWLGYIGHYRASGVLIQAAKYSLPVIATEEGIIGWQVQKYGIGELINSRSVDDIRRGITNILVDEPTYQFYVQNTKKAFFNNTLKNAKKIVSMSNRQ